MIVAGRKVIFKKSFLNNLSKIEQFLGRHQVAKGHAFSAATIDFCCDIIAPFPAAYPAFQRGVDTVESVRRAIFRREYALIYQISPDAVRFLTIYHTRQNPGNRVLAA